MTQDADLLRSALETLPDPFLIWGPDGRLAVAGRRYLEAVGMTREELEGQREEELEATLRRKGATSTPGRPGEAPRLTVAGHQLERHGRPLPGGGRLELFRDVSAEQQEVEKREEVLSVTTHDLRSPLANVRSYAGLLLAGKMADADPRVKRSAEVIARNADRALKLLQSYFDTVRAETGGLDLDRQPASLQELLQETVASRRAIANEKGVEISARLPTPLPSVRVERERMLNALGALLDNAISRAAPHTRVEVLFEDRANEAWVGFADSGPVIDSSEVRQAFDRDQQILKERRLGVGFSLSVASAVAQAHGGATGLSSNPGRTVFHLTIGH